MDTDELANVFLDEEGLSKPVKVVVMTPDGAIHGVYGYYYDDKEKYLVIQMA